MKLNTVYALPVIPFWKIKVIEKFVDTSLKKKQRPNTIQIVWIVKISSTIIANWEAEAAIKKKKSKLLTVSVFLT